MPDSHSLASFSIGHGTLHQGNAEKILTAYSGDPFQLIIADPPYFQVLEDVDWDNSWKDANSYLEWTLAWVRTCSKVLRPDGLFYIFGQLGKREHIWLHICSTLTREMQFHDMIIWDRAVGYNERSDSFTPQYEMILTLRHPGERKVYFNKDAVRIPYDEKTIKTYLRDPRYKDRVAREAHLRKGKYATNILRIPSLKGTSKEKVGHPSQKPLALIKHLVAAGSREGDLVLDPFMGSGTTAVACENSGRRWVGIESNPDYIAMAKTRLKVED